MRKLKTGSRFALLISLFAAVLCSAPRTAMAHKMKVFASAEEEKIKGFIYFPGGGRATGVEVVLKAADGETLDRTKSDDNGEFEFTTGRRMSYRVICESPDGHRAQFEIAAESLPEDLPEPEKAKEPPGDEEKSPEEKTRAEGETKLKRIVEHAVQRQVRPLREELDRTRAKIRLQDILGGIGYILGILGITSYLLSRSGKNGDDKSGDKDISQ
ncbi:MAG: carboxypeptidase-like regulatory domain-containing protein [Candidatus Brocadiia bacterium]